VRAVYDKPNRTLELAATLTPELVPEDDNPRRSGAPSGISSRGRDSNPRPSGYEPEPLRSGEYLGADISQSGHKLRPY
jgi:hypothetical protein